MNWSIQQGKRSVSLFWSIPSKSRHFSIGRPKFNFLVCIITKPVDQFPLYRIELTSSSISFSRESSFYLLLDWYFEFPNPRPSLRTIHGESMISIHWFVHIQRLCQGMVPIKIIFDNKVHNKHNKVQDPKNFHSYIQFLYNSAKYLQIRT